MKLKRLLPDRCRHLFSSRGVALVAVLLTLSVLTLIGLTMTFVSATETLINRNTGRKLVSLYAAESATEEARERIKALLGSGVLSMSDSNQAAYILASPNINPTVGTAKSNPYYDPGYNSLFSTTFLVSELRQPTFSWVRILQKTENRADYNLDGISGNGDAPVFFGYHKYQAPARATQYVNSGPKLFNYQGVPVYLATALARNSEGTRQFISTDIASVPAPPLRAAFFSKGPVLVAENSVHISGYDEETTASGHLHALESQADIMGDTTNLDGSPLSVKAFSTFSYDMASIIKTLRPPISQPVERVASSISRQTGGSYVGSNLDLGLPPAAGDKSVATFVEGSFNISDSRGQGILIVNGDLSITGRFVYFGLIVVKGGIYLQGNGLPGIEIHGAVISSADISQQLSSLTGQVRILNNSFFIKKQFDSLEYLRLAYRELSY